MDETTAKSSSVWDRVVAVGAYVVPVLLIAAGTVVGVNRLLATWSVRSEPVQVDVNRAPTRGPGATDDVVLMGDSITEGSERALMDALSNQYRVRIRARGGYRVEEMEPYAIELASTKPEQVVINLGTNDVLKNWLIDSSVAGLERMVSELQGVRCIHLVTINERMEETKEDETVRLRAVLFNLTLYNIAKRYNAKVIDWATLINKDVEAGSPRGGYTSDSLHPNSLGKHELARLYKTSLDSCR